MIVAASRGVLRLNIGDYALSAFASSMALLSVGQSLQRPQLGTFCVLVLMCGLGFSYLMNRMRRDGSGSRADALLYAALAVLAVFVGPNLNDFLPEGGFQIDLAIVAVLAWMLMLGSFATWSDSTLLFQAVPCISLFALVGVIELFSGSTFAFFLFLIASAFLYARAHHRAMLRQAAAAGYQDLATIQSGPWRWVAGPEWSIASAFVVVLASLLGAPVIQQSVHSVAGTVRLPTPQVRPPTRSPVGNSAAPTAFRIGTGPRELSERVVLRAKLDRPMYLRTATYSGYFGGGWSRQFTGTTPVSEIEAAVADRRARIQSGNFESTQFEIVLVSGLFEELPVPGEVTQLAPALDWRVRADGTVVSESNMPLMAHIRGVCAVPREDAPIVDAPRPEPSFLRQYVDTLNLSPRVMALGASVCASARTDLERAEAIQAEIGRRCTYDLNARPVPQGADPVEHFLFESKEGYCDLFASSMVVLARTQGIPARLVTGYYPFSPQKDEQGFYQIHEADGHAWAELYFEGVGWVPFDATEGAAMAPGSERGQSTSSEPLLERSWFRWAIAGLLGLLALAGVLALASSAKGYRAWTRQENVAVARAYERFCLALQRTAKRPRRIYETPQEYLSAVEGKLGPLAADAGELSRSFEALFYAAPGSGAALEMDRRVGDFTTRLRKLPKTKPAPSEIG